jgi:spermidine/putrescine-binding protein
MTNTATTARRAIATGLALLLATSVLTPAAHAEGELGLLVWEGYADQSFVKDFEAESGCKVQATYVASNDDFVPKMQAGGGGVYDLLSVSADASEVVIRAGFAEPIDTSRIPEWNNVYESFRTVPSLNVDGQVWGVPFTWGANPFIYRTDKIATPPTSIGDLWNPEFKGKVGMWDDKSMLYNAARLLGIADPFKMTDEELETVKNKLIEQKPLVRKYWTTAGELTQLMASDEVWISYTWGGLMLNEAKKLNLPVAEFMPKEGADGWIDNWMIVKDSPNQECAYKYINFMMSAKGQCGVSTVTGYSASNPVAAKTCMSAEEFAAKHQNDVEYVKQLHMWQTPERIEVYTNVWNAVKAAP